MNWCSRAGIGLSGLVGLALLLAGCGESAAPVGKAKEPGKAKETQVAKADEKKESASNHSGWWCNEHGVPEGECSMCNSKVAADFKKKGDWCDKHDRAKSQCFLCDPKLKEKYAAQYRAKYGKEPPAVEDEEKAKVTDKKG